MFRIKICGVTNLDDARAACQAGADAIGLNFFSGSKRCVTPEQAAAIVDVISTGVTPVGVFVNEPAATINSIVRVVGLGWVQLHGEESPADLAEIEAHTKIIRVYRLEPFDTKIIAADIASCRAAGRAPDAVLVDAAVAGEYGGTGHAAPWAQLANHYDWLDGIPLILAGGLRPANVAEAIRTVRPTAVDTASGVESSPGKKNQVLVEAFVRAATTALAG